MALLHRATLTPSKGDLVNAWLPRQPWAPTLPITDGVSYRLDDPAGRVGLEAFLLTATDGVTVHVPLTYRDEPVAGAEQHLLGTMEHSVLGTRWAYDGCADPVWISTLIATILTGGTQAAELVQGGDGVETRVPQVRVHGSGESGVHPPPVNAVQARSEGAMTKVDTESLEVIVVRRVGADMDATQVLRGRWSGRPDGVVLAGVRCRS